MPKGRRKKKNGRSGSSSNSNMEPDHADAPDASAQVERFNAPVGITITSYRVATCDTDGQCEKLLIDGLVKAGILKDDTGKTVKWVKKNSVVKVKDYGEEKTVIVIEEI